MCSDESVDLTVETNYPINRVGWAFGDGQLDEGIEVTHQYASAGDYLATAYITGTNEFSLETVYDTLSVVIHVGDPEYHVDSFLDLCDVDTFEYYGVEYTQSGHYERVGTSVYGCDSTYILTLDMEFTPNFEFVGTHWPIGGSETHISVNEYAIHPLEPRAHIDTVLWQIDCPNWYVEPHGVGKTCTLYIFTYLLEPVTLHAWVVNRCDTVHEEFFVQTSYYDVGENDQNDDFLVAPNPTNGNVTLHFGDLHGKAEIMVFNSQGQKVDAFTVNVDWCRETSYTMPEVKNGLYYFVVKNNGRMLSQKVALIR